MPGTRDGPRLAGLSPPFVRFPFNPVPLMKSAALKFQNCRGFTLAELLVVLAVLGFLIAFLLPGVASLRRKADDAKCLSNLRTTGAAAILFFTDSKGEFFPTKYWEVYPSTASPGVRGMRNYLGIESHLKSVNTKEFEYDTVITCPVMRRKYPDISMALHRCYSYNYYLNFKNPHSKYNAGGYDARPLLPEGYWKMQNVPRPSEMWMFTDALLPAGASAYASSIQDSADHLNGLSFPHDGRQNLVFLDGHVESLTREQFLNRAQEDAFWGKR